MGSLSPSPRTPCLNERREETVGGGDVRLKGGILKLLMY